MTKFSSRSDPDYIAVVGELRRWVRQLDHQARITNMSETYDETLRTPLATSALTPRTLPTYLPSARDERNLFQQVLSEHEPYCKSISESEQSIGIKMLSNETW
jgi:hypothetical protein